MSDAAATRAELTLEFHRFGKARTTEVADALHAAHAAGRGKGMSVSFLLGVGSVETDLRNDVTDGGHGRGVFQQDDRDEEERAFLRAHKGCKSGTWTPVPGKTALDPGMSPTLKAGARRVIQALEDHRRYVQGQARQNGRRIPERDLTRCMLASYNAGPSAAFRGWEAGDVDRNTATGDYSRRVLARAAVFHDLLTGGE